MSASNISQHGAFIICLRFCLCASPMFTVTTFVQTMSLLVRRVSQCLRVASMTPKTNNIHQLPLGNIQCSWYIVVIEQLQSNIDRINELPVQRSNAALHSDTDMDHNNGLGSSPCC